VRKLLRVTTLVGVSLAGIVVSAGPASAATSITNPSSNPFVVPKDAGGNPVPFTVSAAGFVPSSNVFVEQCDGVASTAVGWDPTTNCDLGSSPAAAIADGSGNVTFDSTDVNHTFHPFKGSSPQGLFNCLSVNDPSPNNGLTDYRNCKLRVSTNNSAATADQVFLQLVLPDAPGTVVPPPARLAIAPANVLEGSSSTRALTFTATISRPSALAVTFSYATVAGTAHAGTDFVAKTGQVSIPAGVTSAVIPIQVKGDTAVEPNEIFKVRLSNASGASIKAGLAAGTILNDDPPKAGLRVGIGNASVYEGNTGRRNLRFTVSLSDKSTQSVRVHYATTAGSATAGTDFIAKSANLTIPAGKTWAVVTIAIVGDSTVEPNEVFAVKLTSPLRALIGRANATGNILKDD
jgi:Calx-beta domain